MRNLKKILSLVLAMMMVLSLMATASATSFKDDADITYKEAVEVMSGLGIISGVKNADDTYSFLPKETLNREAAAKIVTYIKLGGNVDKNTADALTNPFSDVSGWSVNVIKYCYSEGIIAGIGGGKFDPKGALDGYAFGKMLLEAAGIDWTVSTATGWRAQVIATLKANKLLTGLETLVMSAPMTREEACQMAWNAMNYTAKGGIVYMVGDVEFDNMKDAAIYAALTPAADAPVAVNSTSGSLADTVFGLKTATGVITANQATGETVTKIDAATVTNGKVTNLANSAVAYNVATDLSMIGHVVNVYYKSTGATGTVYAVVDQSKAISVAAPINTAAAMAAAFGADTDDAAAVYNFVNYAGTQANAITDFTKNASAAAGTYVVYGGDVVSYVAPAAGIGVVGKVTAYTAPTAATTGSVTITGVTAAGAYGETAAITLEKLGSKTANVVKMYDGVMADDFVYLTKIGTNPIVAEKATVVTTTIDARSSTNTTVAYGGATYGVATIGTANMVTANNTDLTKLGLTPVSSATLGKTPYNVVMTATGTVLGYYNYTATSAANSYAVIQDISVTGAQGTASWAGTDFVPATAKVMLLLTDGTTAIYDLKLTDAQTKEKTGATLQTALFGTLAKGDVVKYALSNGLVSEIKDAVAVKTGTALVKGSTLITDQANAYLTADTVFLYWNTDDTTFKATTRYIGYNALKSTGTVAAGVIKTIVNEKNEVVMAYVNASGATVTTTSQFAYIPSMAYTTKYDATLDANVFVYTAFVDGVATELTAISEITATGTDAAPHIATYTVQNGVLTAVAYIAAGTAADTYVKQPISYVSGTRVVANGTEYTCANAKTFVVDATSGVPVVTAGSVVVSSAAYDTYLVIGTAATANAPADLAYIYYVVK